MLLVSVYLLFMALIGRVPVVSENLAHLVLAQFTLLVLVDIPVLPDFQSEMHLMKGIVPQKHERTVFDTIIQQALDSVVSEGEVGGKIAMVFFLTLLTLELQFRANTMLRKEVPERTYHSISSSVQPQ